jgi:hypothetical protein
VYRDLFEQNGCGVESGTSPNADHDEGAAGREQFQSGWGGRPDRSRINVVLEALSLAGLVTENEVR